MYRALSGTRAEGWVKDMSHGAVQRAQGQLLNLGVGTEWRVDSCGEVKNLDWDWVLWPM